MVLIMPLNFDHLCFSTVTPAYDWSPKSRYLGFVEQVCIRQMPNQCGQALRYSLHSLLCILYVVCQRVILSCIFVSTTTVTTASTIVE